VQVVGVGPHDKLKKENKAPHLKQKLRQKQKTPPVVAGQWMLGCLSCSIYPQLRRPVM